MNIPRRAVGSPPSVTKKPSMASLNSSIYTDITRSRSESDSSNFTKDSLSYAGSEYRKTPPLPEKDEQRDIRPVTPKKDPASPKSISSLRSSPGQEIWRRRELLSKKGIEFPDLKLFKSNGSTASPPSQSVLPPPDRSLPSLPGLPSHPKQHKVLLSDRHGGPIPAREAPQPPIPQMGGKVSKLKSTVKRKVSVPDQIDGTGRNGHNNEHQDSSNAVQVAQPEQNTSSLSPNESTLSPSHQNQPSTPQVLAPTTPPYDSSHPPQKIPSRSKARNHPSGSSTETPLLSNILTHSHSRSPSETLTITSLPTIVRSPQPHNPNSISSSLLTPEPSPPPETRSVSNSTSTSASASITISHTRHPSSRTTTTQSYSHAYFPALFSPSTLPDTRTVLRAPQLGREHLGCYAGHKYMRRSRNDLCPVECMVCRKGDVGSMWRCTWCCLRICGECMTVLAGMGKDLEAFLKAVGREVEDGGAAGGGEAPGSGGAGPSENESEREDDA
ncbi:dna polymerase iii subunits gamma and tau protein [Rutstroemia sp. NJR-2017a BBW]|nr:dna polymerase iii subunits gamma and tau protein [Rutstroemia sp. NJR-2017a BBW]